MPVSGYSSQVRLTLIADGRALPLSQIGPGYAILREPASIGPCNADLIVSVDGIERRICVRLVDGIVPFDRMVRIMRCVESVK